jgi:hypothetical protein
MTGDLPLLPAPKNPEFNRLRHIKRTIIEALVANIKADVDPDVPTPIGLYWHAHPRTVHVVYCFDERQQLPGWQENQNFQLPPSKR